MLPRKRTMVAEVSGRHTPNCDKKKAEVEKQPQMSNIPLKVKGNAERKAERSDRYNAINF